MSPATDNFIHSLVEMSKAYEALPDVQKEVDRLQEQHLIDGQIIADREMTILRLQRETDDLLARIRSLEVERDDYGFRALAADDKANALAEVLRNTKAAVEAALKASEPEPVPTSEPEAPSSVETPQVASEVIPSGVSEGERAADPIATVTPISQASFVPDTDKAFVVESTPLGQSVADPTATSETIQSQPVHLFSAEPSASVATKGPYHGKLYMREPGYINRFDWREGGGTDEAYDWRPGNPLPEGYFDYGVKRSIGDVA